MNIFEKFVIGNELIVNEEKWSEIVHLYSQEFIIKEISDAIVLFNISLPYRDIILANVKDEY